MLFPKHEPEATKLVILFVLTVLGYLKVICHMAIAVTATADPVILANHEIINSCCNDQKAALLGRHNDEPLVATSFNLSLGL